MDIVGLERAWARDPGSLCGEFIAAGENRSVYACSLNTRLVIKVCSFPSAWLGYCTSNMAEMLFCHCAPETLLKWVARAVWISPCGQYLAAERADQVPAPVSMVTSIPEILFDEVSAENWGVLEGRPVCVDYERAVFTAINRFPNRLAPTPSWYGLSVSP